MTHRRARAFTMLEIVLASVIGALVVLSCIALFNSMDRIDRALARRADDTGELARLRLVMARTFSTLVMTDQPAPRNPAAADGPGGAPQTPGAPASGSSSRGSGSTPGSATPGASTEDRESTTPRSRSSSSSSTSSAGSSPSGSATSPSGAPIDGNGDGNPESPESVQERTPLPRFLLVAGASPAQPAAQRLEVVLTKPPISDPRAPVLPATVLTTVVDGPPVPASKTASGDEAAGAEVETPEEQTASERAETRSVQTTGEAAGVRGFFELIPESALPDYTPPRKPQAPADFKQPYALLWRQLPIAPGSALAQTRPPAPPPEPIVVARGLESVRWKAFDNRERKDVFSATWQSDLPAYVEMEVLTTSGQYANWMFEVDWVNGPEPGELPAAVATRGRGGGPGAGQGGGPGGRGQGRGPGVGNGQGRSVRVPRGEGARQVVPGRMITDDGGFNPRTGERRRRDGQRLNPGDFNPRDLPPPRPPRNQPGGPARPRPAQTTGGPR